MTPVRQSTREEQEVKMLDSAFSEPEVLTNVKRRFPVGAEVWPTGGVHFRVWAPSCSRVEVVLEKPADANFSFELEKESDGYFAGATTAARAGELYRFRLDGGDGFDT